MPAIIGQKINIKQGTLLGPRDISVEITGQSIALEQGIAHNYYGYGPIVPSKYSNRATAVLLADIQKLEVSGYIELFQLDTTKYSGGSIYRFYSGVNALSVPVVWQGQTYNPFVIEASGFEYTGLGAPPRPKLQLANISGLISGMTLSMSDLVGCKFTRKRTLSKFLDAVNFVGGINPSADPNAFFPDDIYYIDRKSHEDNLSVEFELASVLDINGVQLPRRNVIANNCAWKYRSAECGFTGDAVADEFDNIVTVLASDKCGKRFSSCELRFGTGVLPFGGFPSAGKIR